MIRVEKDRIVSLRFTMKNSSGEVLENTMEGNPSSYLHGSGGIQALLQQQLEGLTTGERKTVYLLSSSGLTSEDFIFDVIIDDVAEASAEELMLGYPVKPVVQKCEVDCDCYQTT